MWDRFPILLRQKHSRGLTSPNSTDTETKRNPFCTPQTEAVMVNTASLMGSRIIDEAVRDSLGNVK